MTTEVIITGTGNPRVASGRAGAGLLVRHHDTILQFDAGRATTLRLAEIGVTTGSLSALFITHHHSDHLVGLHDVLFTRWLENHQGFEPLPVVAPNGPSVTFLEKMMDPWVDDIEVRMRHVDRIVRPDPEIVAFDAPTEPTLIWEHDEVRVLAVSVHHEPVMPAVAYRVETPDGAVVISGDTRVCDEVATISRGADVLVHEVFRNDIIQGLIAERPHMADIADYHADGHDLGVMAAELAVPTLMLTHLIPPPRNEADEAAMMQIMRDAGFEGEVIVGRDLSAVSF